MEQCKTIDLLSYSTGISSDSVKTSVEYHLESCESCRAKLSEIQNERDSFLANNPFESMDFEPKMATVRRFPTFSKVISSVAAMLVIGLIIGKYSQPQRTDQFALKGSAALHIQVEQSDGTVGERTTPVFYPEERIQICYTLTDSASLAIFSVDTSGKVSTYFPVGSAQSEQVTPGVMIPIPNSIRLDRYIGTETYCMIVTKSPIAIDSIASVVAKSMLSHRTPLIDLPAGDTIILYTTEKQERQ